jgi:ABC-2 type transport system permease protein
MGLIKLMLLNFKLMIKDKKVILLMVVMPLAVSSFLCYMIKGDDNTTSFPVAVVLNDSGKHGKILVDQIIKNEEKFYNISELSEEEAKKKIKDGKLLAAYIISKDFSSRLENGEKPEVALIKSGNENVAFKIGQFIDEYINKEVISTGLKKNINTVDKGLIETNLISIETNEKQNDFDYSKFILILIINFIVFSANHVAGEFLAQRKEKTLTRQLTTPHKPWEISGGLILGFALIQMVTYSFVVTALKYIFDLQFEVSLVNILIGMLCMVAVSVSLGLFAVRLTSNEGVLSIIITVLGTGMGFVSGSFTAPHSLPVAMEIIAKFTPQYWFMELMSGNGLIINCIIILLFALVFFTAGSLKFTKFAKE